jgi:UDP-N-acetylglucosamine 2-epimerase (non-hydrolysing)
VKTICIILGTRPEAIKLAPVILALEKSEEYRVLVCNTEQQKELSNQTLSFFGIKADFGLDVMRPNQTLGGLQARILEKLSDVYDNNQIDATIVQGDTMTVFSGALNSFYHKIPVFHVEAGLRSYNLFEPFPEEAMRQMTSRITDLHFAPTELAYHALIKEGIGKENIVLTGNTVIDALSCLSEKTLNNAENFLKAKGIVFNDKLILVTVHRRENHGKRLDQILAALKALAIQFSGHQFVLPVHPNPNVHDKVYNALDKLQNVVLTEPLDYPQLVCLMKYTKLVLTDSGGIQEEAPTFGNPVLVMRYETERTEGVSAGFAQLVGADEEKIISEASKILRQEKAVTRLDGSKNPYGDGHSADKILKAIQSFFRKGN